MAERVIDELETVKVQKQHGHHAIVTARLRERLVEVIHEQVTVGHFRERIMLAQVAQPL